MAEGEPAGGHWPEDSAQSRTSSAASHTGQGGMLLNSFLKEVQVYAKHAMTRHCQKYAKLIAVEAAIATFV